MDLSQKPRLMPEWISFPIEKFSHAASTPPSSNYHWMHESKRDDLFLVFRSVRRQASGLESDREYLMMSISSGGNILEQQDLNRLVDMTQQFESMLQTMAVNMAKIEAPVQIIVRRPCIAMRYTKDPTKVQRIQVRFRQDEDYDTSIDILKNLGLLIKDPPEAISTAPITRPSETNSLSRSKVIAPKPVVNFAPLPNLCAAQVEGVKPEPSTINLPLVSMSKDADRHRSASSETLRSASLLLTPNLYAAQLKCSSPEFSAGLSSVSTALKNADCPRSASAEKLQASSAASQTWLHHNHLARPFPPSSSPSVPTSAIPVSTSNSAQELRTSGNESSLYVAQMLGPSPHTNSPAVLNGEVSQGPTPQHQDFQIPYQGLLHRSVSLNIGKNTDSPLHISAAAYAPAVQGYFQFPRQENGPFSDTKYNETRQKPLPPISISQMQGRDRFEEADGASPAPPPLITTAFDPSIESGSALLQPPKLDRTLSSFYPNSFGGGFVNFSAARNNSLPLHSSQVGSLPPPQSVPVTPQSYDQDWIPPRRELPFLKDRSNLKSRRTKVDAPSELAESAPVNTVTEPTTEASSALEATERVAKRTAKRNARKKPVVQGSNNEPAPQGDPIQPSTVNTIHEEELPVASESLTAPGKVAPTKRPSCALESQLVAAKRPKMVNQSTQTQTGSGRDHTTLVNVLQGNTGTELSESALSTPSSNVLNQIDNYVGKHKFRPGPVDIWHTSRYADASEEERQALVNNWICDNLENKDFLKLCEDVENSWRRIGLGF